MKYFWKTNIFEVQVLLYWILGVLILNIGEWHWLGWLSIAWGWFTFIYVLCFAWKYRHELKDAFNPPTP